MSEGTAAMVPMLLVHSVNAAASAYEIRPLHEHFAASRPVYSLDLPGYGFSERRPGEYTPRQMTDALHAVVALIRRDHGAVAVDALALSLSSEFLARAAVEDPAAFRSLALVSPTGFSGPRRRYGPPGGTRAATGRAAPRWAFRGCTGSSPGRAGPRASFAT